MYSIFHPLDPNERLPRELVLEGRRYRLFERRAWFAAAGFLYLPAIMFAVLFLASLGVPAAMAFVVAGVLFTAAFVWIAVSKEP
jgi:hypothetical protein